MVGAERVRAAHDVVQVQERALLAARPGEGQQVRRDAADPRGLVVHHLEHLAMLGLELVEQQRLREPGDDGRGIVDLVGHPADELAHGGQLLRLLQLRFGALLVGAVPHRRVKHGADAPRAVGSLEGQLELLHLAAERSRHPLADQGGGGGIEKLEHGAAVHGSLGRRHPLRRRVRLEDPTLTIDHHDRIGDGVHHQPEVALRGRGGGERVHERPGLVRHLVLEQRRVAPVGPEGIHEPEGDDRDAAGHEQRSRDEDPRPAIPGRQAVRDRDHRQRDGGDGDQRAGAPAQGSHGDLAGKPNRPPRCWRGCVMFRRRMDRPGWIDAPRASLAQWDTLARFAAEVRRDGLIRVVVCGMGGSSLAPLVLGASFESQSLSVLDSTDPAAVLAAARAPGLERTLFLITSKSGTTVETLAFCRYFAARLPAEQFAAITAPGTPLEALARERRFRAVFSHPPDVGGRYAALTTIGMLPAALFGADGRALLERARAVDVAGAKQLGARLAAAARAGRDKLVLRPPPRVARLADRIEQLVAASTGKDGRGVIPVVDDPDARSRADTETVTDFSADPLDLGAEFQKWEYANWELCSQVAYSHFWNYAPRSSG